MENQVILRDAAREEAVQKRQKKRIRVRACEITRFQNKFLDNVWIMQIQRRMYRLLVNGVSRISRIDTLYVNSDWKLSVRLSFANTTDKYLSPDAARYENNFGLREDYLFSEARTELWGLSILQEYIFQSRRGSAATEDIDTAGTEQELLLGHEI